MQKDVKELVMTIVKPLVTEPDEVSLELIEGEAFMEYHLRVADGDIGRIIGRQGRIIQAIRTVVYFVPVEGKKVRLLVDQ
ncbi:KH domain-containing protein [Lactococcus taiwanensis]|uniref:KH domain-containing protein n=1 Tax=Lactococcus taiwanensis TaxID=1151742 RepID=UPI0023F3E180|nr:KH domain-containing protein [Lactococcus taiwanensis]